MEFSGFYLIKPRPALTAKFAAHYASPIEAALRPQLWSNREGGKTNWTAADQMLKVKLVFLTSLWNMLEGSTAKREFFAEQTALSEQFFDQWWEIERYEVEEEVEIALEYLDREAFHYCEKTASPVVNRWLETVTQEQAMLAHS